MYDILYVIESIMKLVFTYIGICLVKKYVFLEPELEETVQRRFHIASVALCLLALLIIRDEAVWVLFIMVAINILLARKEKCIQGFFLVFPIVGFVNGIMAPIWSMPKVVFRMTEKEMVIYSIILYAILFMFIVLFYFMAKKRHILFEDDMKVRYLEKWERVLLSTVGMILIFYSNTFSALPTSDIANETVISKIIFDKVISSIAMFSLTVTVIILILQGNKKACYFQKTMNMSKQMVNALAKTIDAKDKYTKGHSIRVAKYSIMIAKRMGYDGKKLEQLEFSALLHDIGKIGVPREIINKTSRLTDDEYEIIKTHPETGANILKEVTEIPDIVIGARWHHERYDGKGYPDKLVGKDIPELARIIGVADAYDAMTSKRSYRDVLSQEIVKSEIEKGKGTQFDPQIANIMLVLIEEDKEYEMHE